MQVGMIPYYKVRLCDHRNCKTLDHCACAWTGLKRHVRQFNAEDAHAEAARWRSLGHRAKVIAPVEVEVAEDVKVTFTVRELSRQISEAVERAVEKERAQIVSYAEKRGDRGLSFLIQQKRHWAPGAT